MAITTKKGRKQLAATLLSFYHQPVAKVSLELFLTLGTVIFFALFAIRPTLLTMSDLIKEIEDKQTLNKQLAQKVAALSTAQNEYLIWQNRVYVLDEAIPANPQLIDSLKIIEKIASDHNLVISSLQINEIPDDVELQKLNYQQLERQAISIKLVVTGNYEAIRDLAESLRQSRRTFIVDTIVFSVEDTRGYKNLKANITVLAPYFTSSVAGTKTNTSTAKK